MLYHWMRTASGSIARANRRGDSLHPCLVPLAIEKVSMVQELTKELTKESYPGNNMGAKAIPPQYLKKIGPLYTVKSFTHV